MTAPAPGWGRRRAIPRQDRPAETQDGISPAPVTVARHQEARVPARVNVHPPGVSCPTCIETHRLDGTRIWVATIECVDELLRRNDEQHNQA